MGRSVVQEWVSGLPMMQQTVLLTVIRGPDGVEKYSPIKYLLRWFRRCVLLSAMDGKVLTSPEQEGGGSFTGQSLEEFRNASPQSSYAMVGSPRSSLPFAGPFSAMDALVIGSYMQQVDCIPLHFHMHLMHAIEILGYKHPDPYIRGFWNRVYRRFVAALHLQVEDEATMDERLGDNREDWFKHSDPATTA